MKKYKEPKFIWHEKTGIAICTINDKFIGMAYCHEDDTDMKSEKVGCEIAYNRALIKSLKYEKNNVIIPSLRALRQLYYSMIQSKRFNPKSYEANMLKRQIENWEFDLKAIENAIESVQEYIQYYIKTKDELYQHIRKNRKDKKE